MNDRLILVGFETLQVVTLTTTSGIEAVSITKATVALDHGMTLLGILVVSCLLLLLKILLLDIKLGCDAAAHSLLMAL